MEMIPYEMLTRRQKKEFDFFLESDVQAAKDKGDVIDFIRELRKRYDCCLKRCIDTPTKVLSGKYSRSSINFWIIRLKRKPPIIVGDRRLQDLIYSFKTEIHLFRLIDPSDTDPFRSPGRKDWESIGPTPGEVREIAEDLIQKNGRDHYEFQRMPSIKWTETPSHFYYPNSLIEDIEREIKSGFEVTISPRTIRRRLRMASFLLTEDFFIRVIK